MMFKRVMGKASFAKLKDRTGLIQLFRVHPGIVKGTGSESSSKSALSAAIGRGRRRADSRSRGAGLFEQVVSAAAYDHGFLYGLATALMAVATGWLASVVFRRD
jgi:hypothetical protein